MSAVVFKELMKIVYQGRRTNPEESMSFEMSREKYCSLCDSYCHFVETHSTPNDEDVSKKLEGKFSVLLYP